MTQEAAKTLSKQNEIINEDLANPHDGNIITGERSERKRAFVEPAISAPVDVLEATTFFQQATSGPSN